jgi:hypothetical protein
MINFESSEKKKGMDLEKDSVVDLEEKAEKGSAMGSRSNGSRKKYKKEEHFLKKVLMSRLSETSRSGQSIRSLNGKRAKYKKKPYTRKFSKPVSFAPSAAMSFKSGISKSSSFSNFSNLRFKNPPKIDPKILKLGKSKKQASSQLITVKVEESEMSGLRKRVCRKVNEILVKEFKLQKSMSKRLTLAIEAKVNHHFDSNSESYLNVIKNVFRKLRVS